MPRTTRAVDRSSHLRAPVDTRAVHGSSHHRSSSDSLESGRERRRKGKLKMQQQLTAARARISDLEQQNLCLRRLVEELTRSIALPAGPASPELFDVYNIAEETSSVATQTDISVDLSKPDIFVCSLDLPQHSPTSTPAHGTTAHADAAAGRDFSTDSREQTSAIADTPQQAPEVVHSRHCGAMLEPDVTHSGVPHDLAAPVIHSQGLAKLRALYGEPTLCAIADTPQPAPDDDNSRHCGVQLEPDNELMFARSPCVVRADFNSQDLAPSFEHIGTVVSTQCGPLPRQDKPESPDHELLSANLVHDSNSQAHASQRSPWRDYEPHVDDTPQQAPEDGNSRHCGDPLEPDDALPRHSGVSKDLGIVARSSCVVHADFNSQDLAPSFENIGTVVSTQCGPLPRLDKPDSPDHEFLSAKLVHASNSQAHASPRSPWHEVEPHVADTPQQAPDDVNSRHCGSRLAPDDDLARQNVARGPCVVCADFNSQDLASSSEIIGTVISTQCGPLPRHIKPDAPDLELLNANPGCDSNSQTHASLRSPWQEYEPHDPKVVSFGPSTREQHKQLAEFQAAAAPAIAAYKRRHKPSNGQVRRAAAAICAIARNHGLTKEQCIQHLREHSLALTTAATDSW